MVDSLKASNACLSMENDLSALLQNSVGKLYSDGLSKKVHPAETQNIGNSRTHRYQELDLISQRTSHENKDTKLFLHIKNLPHQLKREQLISNQTLTTSQEFRLVDEFKGRFLKSIYDHN